ncbi:hypothetical protein [Shimazuella alba]|uniref:Uncharacterized protein n=1 Tax=Shimazuella alba TaxID=2690964 RepID=A0A6I4VN79_9BACL|nr:hypothetical protein [Shimazuella alba]MXQ52967.1 hypothetical protein [Shimazuella alba]
MSSFSVKATIKSLLEKGMEVDLRELSPDGELVNSEELAQRMNEVANFCVPSQLEEMPDSVVAIPAYISHPDMNAVLETNGLYFYDMQDVGDRQIVWVEDWKAVIAQRFGKRFYVVSEEAYHLPSETKVQRAYKDYKSRRGHLPKPQMRSEVAKLEAWGFRWYDEGVCGEAKGILPKGWSQGKYVPRNKYTTSVTFYHPDGRKVVLSYGRDDKYRGPKELQLYCFLEEMSEESPES